MLYNYLCNNCGRKFEAYRMVKDRAYAKCECGVLAHKQFTLGQAIHVFIPYFDLGLDKQVDSLKEKRKIMKTQEVEEDSSAGMQNIQEI